MRVLDLFARRSSFNKGSTVRLNADGVRRYGTGHKARRRRGTITAFVDPDKARVRWDGTKYAPPVPYRFLELLA